MSALYPSSVFSSGGGIYYTLAFINIEEDLFGSLSGAASNLVGSAFNTAFGRDCRGRPQGDYFYGCQVITSCCG